MAITVNIPVSSITVGERRREEYGAVDELAASIARYGLLHPLVVDMERNLVAGRRLTAVTQLGWEQVPVRMLDTLTPAELREIELEENLQRKDFTSYELDKTLMEVAEAAAEADKEGFRVESTRNPEDAPDDAGFVDDFNQAPEARQSSRLESKRGGRPEKPGSLRRVADRIGVSEGTIRQARKHVETADTYPFMQKPDWKQHHVLQAREVIERLPQAERHAAAAVIDKPEFHPKVAVELLGNIAQKSAEERREIYRLNASSDKRDRDLADTMAAGISPMPDPRLTLLDFVLDKLRAATKPYPNDPLTPRLRAVRDEVRAIKVEVEAVSYNANRQTERTTM